MCRGPRSNAHYGAEVQTAARRLGRTGSPTRNPSPTPRRGWTATFRATIAGSVRGAARDSADAFHVRVGSGTIALTAAEIPPQALPAVGGTTASPNALPWLAALSAICHRRRRGDDANPCAGAQLPHARACA